MRFRKALSSDSNPKKGQRLVDKRLEERKKELEHVKALILRSRFVDELRLKKELIFCPDARFIVVSL